MSGAILKLSTDDNCAAMTVSLINVVDGEMFGLTPVIRLAKQRISHNRATCGFLFLELMMVLP